MGIFDYAKKATFFMSNPDWVWYDENEIPHLTEKAPPEAVESYRFWKERFEKSQKTGIIYD